MLPPARASCPRTQQPLPRSAASSTGSAGATAPAAAAGGEAGCAKKSPSPAAAAAGAAVAAGDTAGAGAAGAPRSRPPVGRRVGPTAIGGTELQTHAAGALGQKRASGGMAAGAPAVQDVPNPSRPTRSLSRSPQEPSPLPHERQHRKRAPKGGTKARHTVKWKPTQKVHHTGRRAARRRGRRGRRGGRRRGPTQIQKVP